MDQGRKFTCTIWDDWLPEFDPEIFSYGVFGHEQAPDTGRWHWQGYFETKTKRNNLALVKKLDCVIPPHIEHARGTQDENYAYCTKDGDFYEFGTRMVQGERTDLKELTNQIYTGELTLDDVILNKPTMYHQFGRTLQATEDVRLKRLKHPSEPRETVWVYGPAGVGKSRYVNEICQNAYYWQPGHFQEYLGEDTVVIEEFRANTMSIADFLLLTDPYYSNLFIDRKGRSRVRVVAKYIFITSNFSPEEIFNAGEHPQVLRRLKIKKM